MKYAILVECRNGRFSGYSPDFPGCIALGTSLEEIVAKIDTQVAAKVGTMPKTGFFGMSEEKMVPHAILL